MTRSIFARGLARIASVLVLAGCRTAGTMAPGAAGPAVAFVHASVVDVEAGRVLHDRTVVTAGGRIVAVDSGLAAPRGARVVEARGKFLVPGLWDMHVHAFTSPDSTLGIVARAADVFFPLFVAAGVTGIRDMGASPDSLAAVRRLVASRSLLAPRIVASGPSLTGPSPYGPPVPHTIRVRTAEEARAAVDSLRRAGADFVKVHDLLSSEAYRAAAAEARRVGLPLAGHLRPSIDPREAMALGQASFEHMAPELSAWCAADGAVRADSFYAIWGRGQWSFASSIAGKRWLRESRDERSCTGLRERMRAGGTHLVPTLVYELVDSAAPADPWLAYLPRAMRRFCTLVAEYRLQAPAAERAAHARAVLADVRAMHEAGVPLLAGTDLGAACGAPGFALHDELARLVQAGLTPAEALRTATIAPARFLHAADTLGTVAAGRGADLVLLDADPLADIRNLRAVSGVMLRGRWLPRAELDRMLAAVKTRVQP